MHPIDDNTHILTIALCKALHCYATLYGQMALKVHSQAALAQLHVRLGARGCAKPALSAFHAELGLTCGVKFISVLASLGALCHTVLQHEECSQIACMEHTSLHCHLTICGQDDPGHWQAV